MAAAKANLLDVLTKDAYARFDELNAILGGPRRCLKHGLAANAKLLGAKGSVEFRRQPIHEYRDLWDIDDRLPQLAWIWQLNRGVFKSPARSGRAGRPRSSTRTPTCGDTWTTSSSPPRSRTRRLDGVRKENGGSKSPRPCEVDPRYAGSTDQAPRPCVAAYRIRADESIVSP